MFRGLLRLLNVEKGEETPVLLLLGMGFFMGTFLFTYKIVAEALFLSTFSEDVVSQALFISAAVGVISTGIFASLQNRIPFSRLAILNYTVIFIFLGATRFAFETVPQEHQNTVVFVMFIMFQPIMSITFLGFWGLFGRIFNLRQSKRIIGGIDSGQLLAAIIASFTVSIINQYIKNIDFLLISMGAIFMSAIFLLFLFKKVSLDGNRSGATEQRVNTKITKIFKNKYVVLLSSFLFLSMLAFMLIHFSFLSVTDIYFPSEKRLVGFLGIFNGSIMILSLLMQTFVNDRLIAMYGLRTALLVLPVILLIFTGITIGVGSYFGYTAASATFAWFFLFISLSKLFMESLKEALENPSFKLFFMPLDIKIRFDIQAKVEGVVNEFSRFIAGLVILILGFLSYFKLIHFSYLLFGVIIIWIFVTYKLYSEYRQNVKKKLQGHHDDQEYKQKKINYIRNLLSEITQKTSSEKIIFSLKLMEKFDPNIIKSCLNELISNKDKNIRKFALDKVNSDNSSNGNFKVFELSNSQQKGDLEKWINKINKNGAGVTNAEYHEMVRSNNPDDRIHAAKLLISGTTDDNVSVLLELLYDSNETVRSAAIETAATVKRPETFPILVEHLLHLEYAEKASDAFVKMGEVVFPYLETTFYKTNQDIRIMLKIIQIYGRVGGAKAIGLLWNKIDFPDKKVVSYVLIALSSCGFSAKGTQITRINYAIENDINNVVWHLMAINNIPNWETTENLKQALREDIKSNINHIFILLSMIYDPHSIQLIKENLDSKTSEGITYALELIDVIVADDIKEKIIILLDDISESEKFNKLQNFYPQINIDYKELLNQIINRDYNQISRYSKATALYYVGKYGLANFDMDLISNLFNPDQLLKETAAWSLYHTNENLYNQHTNRLDFQEKLELDALVLPSDKHKEEENILLKLNTIGKYDKIIFLKEISLFNNIPGVILSHMVDIISEVHLSPNELMDINQENHRYFFIVYRGEIQLLVNEEKIGNYSGKQMISEIINNDYRDKIQIQSTKLTVLLKIEKERFYDLLSEHYEVSLRIIEQFKDDVDQVDISAKSLNI